MNDKKKYFLMNLNKLNIIGSFYFFMPQYFTIDRPRFLTKKEIKRYTSIECIYIHMYMHVPVHECEYFLKFGNCMQLMNMMMMLMSCCSNNDLGVNYFYFSFYFIFFFGNYLNVIRYFIYFFFSLTFCIFLYRLCAYTYICVCVWCL